MHLLHYLTGGFATEILGLRAVDCTSDSSYFVRPTKRNRKRTVTELPVDDLRTELWIQKRSAFIVLSSGDGDYVSAFWSNFRLILRVLLFVREGFGANRRRQAKRQWLPLSYRWQNFQFCKLACQYVCTYNRCWANLLTSSKPCPHCNI